MVGRLAADVSDAMTDVSVPSDRSTVVVGDADAVELMVVFVHRGDDGPETAAEKALEE